MQTFNTLADILVHNAQEFANKSAFTFIRGEGDEVAIDYQTFFQRCSQVAHHLHHEGAQGERVMIMLDHGLDYVVTFFGCIMAGGIAVPVYPPQQSRSSNGIDRFLNIVGDCSPKFAVTSRDLLQKMLALPQSAQTAGIKWFDVEAFGREDHSYDLPALIKPSDVAFLQYTSGSTGKPKGVILTHENILANQYMIDDCFRLNRDSVGISWLPMYHDMGLIGNIIHPLFKGMSTVHMSPLYFMAKPVRWLEAMSRFGGTASGAPNFGYQLCVDKVKESDVAHLNLSAWQLAYCGSEPVKKSTLDAFSEKFAGAGFNSKAFCPCYGMAEATLLVTGRTAGTGYIALGEQQENVANQREAHLQLISNGTERAGAVVKIVDPELKQACEDGLEGEIWVSSPANGLGYWNKTAVSDEIFRAHIKGDERNYLRTGDLGLIRNGELYVTGRFKDLIIVRGKNIHNNDIEAAVEAAHDSVRAGRVAAFGVDDITGEERLVIVFECSSLEKDKAQVVQAIVRRVKQEVGVNPHHVVMVPAKAIPRTSSGKIQRRECKERYVRGELEIIAHSSASRKNREGMLAASDMERQLADIVSTHLQIKEVFVDDDIFVDLGLDSVDSAELVQQINKTLGHNLPMRTFYDHPTIETLAEHLERLASTDRSATVSHIKSAMTYLHKDAELDIEITGERYAAGTRIETLHERGFSRDGVIFVTGVTGYIGPLLISNLLHQTEARLICLVRAESTDAGLQRILSGMEKYGLNDKELMSRVTVVCGDIETPRFGLSTETWDSLAEQVDIIFHNGAKVDFLHNYNRFKKANVESCKEALKLATQSKLKIVYYSSTEGIYHTHSPYTRFMESDEVPELTEIAAVAKGYLKAKWVAEKLMLAAQQRNIPICILRIGMVSGHSKTGYGAGKPLIGHMYLGAAQLGSVPKYAGYFDMTPVDYAAYAMVHLAKKKESINNIYNIHNPNEHRAEQMFDLIRELGHPLETLEFLEWKSRILACDKDNALYAFKPLVEGLQHSPFRPLFDNSRFMEAVQDATTSCPPVDIKLVGTYFAEYYETGAMRPPAKA